MTGKIPDDVLDLLLDTLPVEISFIDAEDTVRYFNKNGRRIFARSSQVIGRRVQDCHPPKSLDKVNAILEAFKKGEKDSEEFWIGLKDRLVYIRYFAVRDETKRYLGCLEATQDITEIQKITGEKRLI